MSVVSTRHSRICILFKAIHTTVNGVEVHGYSEARLHTITTTITKPFKHISQSWHIPYFAQGHMSYHGKHGEWRARESLEDIYRVAEYVHRKEDMLKRKYQELEERKSELSEGRMSESEFKLQRRAEYRKNKRYINLKLKVPNNHSHSSFHGNGVQTGHLCAL